MDVDRTRADMATLRRHLERFVARRICGRTRDSA